MILIIDNYDSFTYNIVQEMGELGAEIEVVRNNQITLEGIRRLNPSHIVISPGPGFPKDAGISNDVIREFGATTPILGAVAQWSTHRNAKSEDVSSNLTGPPKRSNSGGVAQRSSRQVCNLEDARSNRADPQLRSNRADSQLTITGTVAQWSTRLLYTREDIRSNRIGPQPLAS